MNNRNKGFTLVEIVTAIGILAILSISFMSIMIGAQNQASKEIAVGHVEPLLIEARDKIKEAVSEANVGLKYWDNSDGSLASSEECKILAAYKLSDNRNEVVKTYFKYDCNTKNMYTATAKSGYSVVNGVNDTFSDVLGKSWSKLIGDWMIYIDDVTEFEVVINEKTMMTNILLSVEYDDQQFTTQRSVFTKNNKKNAEIVNTYNQANWGW